MRILFLTSHLDIGGIPIYTVSVAKALARRGHELVVVSSGGTLVAELEHAGIPHHRLDLAVKSELHPKVLMAVLRIGGSLRRWRPDVIHAQTRVAQVAAGLISRLTGVPVVTTAHGFYRWRRGRYLFPFWGRCVVAISPETRRKLTVAYRVPSAKIALVLNGIAWAPPPEPELRAAVEAFRQAWGIHPEHPVVGAVARLSPAKGLPVLIEAFHRLRRPLPEAQLLIVGDGPDRAALIRQVYALGEQDHVIFSGYAARTAIPLSVMDVFAMPSLQEAFGLSAVEAMAMARPVVASSVGGLRTIVRHGQTGLLVPRRDPEALAAAIERLLRHPEEARAMGAAGQQRYEQEFTVDRVAAQLEPVYAQAIHGVAR